MKPTSVRVAHYNNRMLSTSLDPTLAAVAVSAAANYSTFADDYGAKQEGLHAILDPAGVPLVSFAAYNAFNGRMYHFSKVTSGVSLVTIATALVAEWSAAARLGTGSATTLRKICLDLYQITVPVPSP
jgi:hypothetical protein